MRKVEREVITKFISGESCTVSNTHTDGDNLYLHGNLIAERLGDGSYWVSNAGWHTRTTRSRINALCALLKSKAYVWIKDYTMYIMDHRGNKDVMDGAFICIRNGDYHA